MESEIKHTKSSKRPKYPALYKSKDNGRVVLFTEAGIGFLVYSKDERNIGHSSSGWEMGRFELFEGEITLSN